MTSPVLDQRLSTPKGVVKVGSAHNKGNLLKRLAVPKVGFAAFTAWAASSGGERNTRRLRSEGGLSPWGIGAQRMR